VQAAGAITPAWRLAHCDDRVNPDDGRGDVRHLTFRILPDALRMASSDVLWTPYKDWRVNLRNEHGGHGILPHVLLVLWARGALCAGITFCD